MAAIKLADVDGNLTDFGGLFLFRDLWKKMGMHREVKKLLPNCRNSKSIHKRHQQKFNDVLFSFLADAECLSDIERHVQDVGFRAASESPGYSDGCYGDFLRKFEPWQVRKFNELLKKMAFDIRRRLFPNDRQFILDCDSTMHEQHAKKMEGLGWSHDNKWGLDSIQAYDQFGLAYWLYVREGGTFTANSASTIIQKVFRGMPKFFERFFRGDSGFCNHDVFRECADYGVGFVIAGRANMHLPRVKYVRNWRRAKGVTFHDGREADIGTTFYYQKNGRETIRIVYLRARKKNPTMFEDPYEYRAWFTNTGDHEFKWEEVIEFYRGRGNAENFIREIKNGYDLHHFPCKSLTANKIYGVIAAMAHNLIRIASLTYDAKQFHYSKWIRNRLVRFAALVVKGSRYLIFRMNHHRRKEVELWLTTLRSQFGFG